MKRFVAFLLVMLIMTGCAASATSKVTLPPSFNSEVNVTIGDTVYGACLSRYADSCWLVEMTAPAAVKGLIFTVTNGETEVGLNGLHFSFDTEKFPAGAVAKCVMDAVDRLYAQPLDVIVGDESCLATGTLGNESFTLSMTKNYVPQKLEFGEMTVEFLKFDVIEKLEEGEE